VYQSEILNMMQSVLLWYTMYFAMSFRVT